jgi:hypothetical protein
MNREKTAMIMSLQKQLDVVRAKTLKSRSSKAAQRKMPAKSKAHPVPKVPPGKKAAPKGIGVR